MSCALHAWHPNDDGTHNASPKVQADTLCRRCRQSIEVMCGGWWTKGLTDFMCPDGEDQHEPA